MVSQIARQNPCQAISVIGAVKYDHVLVQMKKISVINPRIDGRRRVHPGWSEAELDRRNSQNHKNRDPGETRGSSLREQFRNSAGLQFRTIHPLPAERTDFTAVSTSVPTIQTPSRSKVA